MFILLVTSIFHSRHFEGEAHVTNMINDGSVLLKSQISYYDSVIVSQHAQYQDPETQASQ